MVLTNDVIKITQIMLPLKWKDVVNKCMSNKMNNHLNMNWTRAEQYSLVFYKSFKWILSLMALFPFYIQTRLFPPGVWMHSRHQILLKYTTLNALKLKSAFTNF